MRLRDNLYCITDRAADGFKIHFNPQCVIYAAHFPGQPTTPGVCIVQTVAELTEELLRQPLDIVEIKSSKFLNVITPNGNCGDILCRLDTDCADDGVTVRAELYDANLVFAKMTLVCRQR